MIEWTLNYGKYGAITTLWKQSGNVKSSWSSTPPIGDFNMTVWNLFKVPDTFMIAAPEIFWSIPLPPAGESIPAYLNYDEDLNLPYLDASLGVGFKAYFIPFVVGG